MLIRAFCLSIPSCIRRMQPPWANPLITARSIVAAAARMATQASDRMNSFVRFVVSQVSKSNPHPSDEDLSPGTPRPEAPNIDTPSSGQRPRDGRGPNTPGATTAQSASAGLSRPRISSAGSWPKWEPGRKPARRCKAVYCARCGCRRAAEWAAG